MSNERHKITHSTLLCRMSKFKGVALQEMHLEWRISATRPARVYPMQSKWHNISSQICYHHVFDFLWLVCVFVFLCNGSDVNAIKIELLLLLLFKTSRDVIIKIKNKKYQVKKDVRDQRRNQVFPLLSRSAQQRSPYYGVETWGVYSDKKNWN